MSSNKVSIFLCSFFNKILFFNCITFLFYIPLNGAENALFWPLKNKLTEKLETEETKGNLMSRSTLLNLHFGLVPRHFQTMKPIYFVVQLCYVVQIHDKWCTCMSSTALLLSSFFLVFCFSLVFWLWKVKILFNAHVKLLNLLCVSAQITWRNWTRGT